MNCACKKKQDPTQPLMSTSIEVRANQFILAWKDTMTHPLLNTHDPNVLYSLWSANMARRGLSPLYTTESLFEASKRAAIQDELTIAYVIQLIEGMYQQELECELKQNSETRFQQPICMN